MRQIFGKYFGRLKDDESGNASVEFVLVFPAFLALMLMSIELGYVTLRHTLLERGLDIAVRQIRLGTGTPGSYDEIKVAVCDNAGFLINCQENLRLEMKPVDLRAFASLDDEVKCTENAEPVDPVILNDQFEFGVPNELMVLRACYRYKPFFPDDFLGNALTKDTETGEVSIITTAAFVQEPL